MKATFTIPSKECLLTRDTWVSTLKIQRYLGAVSTQNIILLCVEGYVKDEHKHKEK
jgi:hypothetical protein